jgi:hypothetical protein
MIFLTLLPTQATLKVILAILAECLRDRSATLARSLPGEPNDLVAAHTNASILDEQSRVPHQSGSRLVVFPEKSLNDASLAHTGCPKKQQRRHPVARWIAQQLAKADQNLFSSRIFDPLIQLSNCT